MSFNRLLRDAEPEEFAKAAKVLAMDALKDPLTTPRARKIAEQVLAMTHEELVASKPSFDERWDANHDRAE